MRGESEEELYLALDELANLYEEVNLFYDFAQKLPHLFTSSREEACYELRNLFFSLYPDVDYVFSCCSENGDIVLRDTIGDIEFTLTDSVKEYLKEALEVRDVVIFNDCNEERVPWKHFIVIPVYHVDKVYGVIILGRKENKPFMAHDARILNALALMTGAVLKGQDLLKERREREKLELEIRVASDIQRAILPSSLPKEGRFRLSAWFEPARIVGGDYYDIFPMSDGSIIGVIADVSGKGVPAAFLTAMLKGAISALVRVVSSPGQLLAKLNEMMCLFEELGRFVTMAIFALLPDGRGKIAVGGHLPPILLKKTGIVEVKTGGPPLGVLSSLLEYPEEEVFLEDGECVLLYTDGLIEALSPEGEFFGEERLKNLLKELISVEGKLDITFISEIIKERVKKFMEGKAPRDDITLFIVGLSKLDTRRNIDVYETVIPSSIENIRTSIAPILTKADELGFSAEDIYDLKLALNEAILNAIFHGNSGRIDKKVFIKALWDYDKGMLEISVRDEGEGFNFQEIARDETSLREGGRGISIMRAVMDDLYFIPPGNEVVLVKKFRKEEVSIEKDLVEYHPRGKLNHAKAVLIKCKVEEILHRYRPKRLRIDMSGINFIDVKGIQALMELKREAERRRIEISFVRWQDEVKRVLKTMGLEDLLDGDKEC
ncbi:MAG: SpoIIE family protein phosphatase [Synergistetes bacterium]|nr:SpoIIE family protein phosphatase [Synergistota bacterium]